jgi:AcrR family transcriptional regulator
MRLIRLKIRRSELPPFSHVQRPIDLLGRFSGGSDESRGVTTTETKFRKLKPRPGHSGRDVEQHQRARLHAATIDLVSMAGYGGLTVTGIARAAGVANRTFYENFQGKEDCFLATYDLIVRNAAREVLAAHQREKEPQEKVGAAIFAFLGAVAENPKAAHLILIEAPEVEAALERTPHTTGLFEALVTKSFAGPPASIELPAAIAKGIVAGVSHTARSCLLNRSEADLSAESEELAEWALSLGSSASTRLAPPSRQAGASASKPSPAPRANGFDSDYSPGDEREMILWAVSRLAAGEGYRALTMPRIRSAVGISQRRFNQHFPTLAECFLASLNLHYERLLAQPWATATGTGRWQVRVYRTLATFCGELVDNPMVGKLLFLEARNAGREGARWRAEMIAGPSSFIYGRVPAESRPTPLAAEASLAGVWALLDAWVTVGQTQPPSQVAGLAAYLVLAPTLGAEAAVETIRAEQGARRRTTEPAV